MLRCNYSQQLVNTWFVQCILEYCCSKNWCILFSRKYFNFELYQPNTLISNTACYKLIHSPNYNPSQCTGKVANKLIFIKSQHHCSQKVDIYSILQYLPILYLINFRGRAPIASMDAMEELDGMDSCDILTGSNPAMQPDCHMLGKGVVPGLRYRHLGKSGLKVDNHHKTFWHNHMHAWIIVDKT